MDTMSLDFNPEDPFPLIEGMRYSYEEAKSHSRQADHWLKLKTYRTEQKIRLRSSPRKPAWDHNITPWEDDVVLTEQEWSGLEVQALLTPYYEIRSLLALLPLQKGQRVVDLGCAYARMGHVIGAHYPDTYFTGYEIAEERVKEAKRILEKFDYPKVEVIQQDLSESDFKPIPADYYFIYDFGTPQSIQKSLNDLREVALSRSVHVIARGGRSRHLIFQGHAWLCEVHPPRNFPRFTIFRS